MNEQNNCINCHVFNRASSKDWKRFKRTRQQRIRKLIKSCWRLPAYSEIKMWANFIGLNQMLGYSTTIWSQSKKIYEFLFWTRVDHHVLYAARRSTAGCMTCKCVWLIGISLFPPGIISSNPFSSLVWKLFSVLADFLSIPVTLP